MNVFVLATVRKRELLKFTTLVFDSLRVGFPTANVHVDFNDLQGKDYELHTLEACCEKVGATFNHCTTIHHEWLQKLIFREQEPFWIVDTDVIFYSTVERWRLDSHLAGWRIPEWNDDFSGCITRARLHTSLLYIDPAKVRSAAIAYERKIANTVFTPKVNLIFPLVVPMKGKPYFYDTCSLLYHAIGGQAFTDEQKDAYFHFHFGTISDIVLPRLSDEESSKMEQARNCVISNPSFGRGVWRMAEQYYANHPV